MKCETKWKSKLDVCLSVDRCICVEREKKKTWCHWMLYCTYDMLNMFRAPPCPSSGSQDYMCVITAYGVQCLVAGCRGSGADQQSMLLGRGMLQDVQRPSSWTHSLLPCTWHPTTSNQALHTIGGNNTHIVSRSWWWAWRCPKHAEHIISAIKHSVISSWFFFSTQSERALLPSAPPPHKYCLLWRFPSFAHFSFC